MNNFHVPTQKELEAIKKRYPVGARVELISMDDPYNTSLVAGSKGTITDIDSLGDLLIKWDSGSCLKLIIGADQFRVISR